MERWKKVGWKLLYPGKVLSVLIPIVGFGLLIIFLQAMGCAAASTMLSMIREVVFGVGFALLLPVFFGLDGVLYSMPVSDILTFLVAVFLIRGTYQQLSVKG